MHTKHLKIIGCGGQARVVIDALSIQDHLLKISLCDSNPDLLGKELAGIMIDSTMDSLKEFSGYVHIAVGNNQIRQKIVAMLNANSSLYTVIHPAAVIAQSAKVHAGSFIAAKALLGPDAVVGEGCIINHGAVVDHEVHVGACSHIAPNSTLGGNVMIGKRVLVGAGAVILPGIRIGDDAIVAAGAVVTKNVKENTTVKGVPAV